MSTNVLCKTNGEIAKGVQNATLAVRRDSAFGLKFNGAQTAPGESVEVQIDMGQGDNLLLPHYPSVNGKVDTTEFMIQIDKLKLLPGADSKTEGFNFTSLLDQDEPVRLQRFAWKY